MPLSIRELETGNIRAMNTMLDSDLMTAREFYIFQIMKARRANDSDTLEAAIDWLCALTGEMQLRGSMPKVKL